MLIGFIEKMRGNSKDGLSEELIPNRRLRGMQCILGIAVIPD